MTDRPSTTKLRKTAITYQATKQLLLSILNSIPALVTVLDKDYKVIFSNWSGRHKYASNNACKANQRCYETYYPEMIRQCEPCHLKEVFELGKVLITEKYDPQIGYVEINAFPLFDAQNNVIMAGECIRNISERRLVQNALTEKNNLLEAVINASPTAIIAMDFNLNVILWNSEAEKMFGWTKEEILDKPYPILPDFLMDEINYHIKRLNKGETFCGVETLRQQKDGSLINVSISAASLLNRDGVPIGYVAVLADIRESKETQQALRESETNYRTIFNAATEAIFVIDAGNASILDINFKVCEIYGYTSKEIHAMTFEDLSAGYPPYAKQDFLEKIWKTRYEKSHMFEWLAKDSSGRLFWLEVNMKGAVIGGKYKVLAVCRDISERKATEEKNRKMQERLRQVDKMAAIGTLASGIAHEINNPNNFILTNAQFIMDIWPDISKVMTLHAEEKGDFFLGNLLFSETVSYIPKVLEGLLEGSHRINSIVAGLKDFARQEKTLLDQKVDINKVIEAALQMLHNEIRKHTDKFQCILAENLPPVTGSFQQLEQVIINLTMNALQALTSREEGVSISTSYVRSIGEILIKVTDEGVGMPDDVRQAIFDPFYTTKQDSGGTGLGLSICFSIVKEHGGIIECESEPGRGATFFVRLPVQQGTC